MEWMPRKAHEGFRLTEIFSLRDWIDEILFPVLYRPFRHRSFLLRPSLLITTPFALAGCEDALSTVHPAGPAAATISTLWWVMLIGSTVIFLFVMALIVLAWRRPAGAISERRFIVGLGLVFPLTVLAALLAYGLVVGERLLPRNSPEVVTVRAEGRQWAWRFAYADAPGLETEGVLHIPAARPVDVEITSVDVVHSFWVPRLAGKLDAVPGYVNVLRIEAYAPGEYRGVSAEYNGPGYLGHRFTVVAHDASSWDAFLQEERP